MRVITLNANGIRAAAKKGVAQWLDASHADIVCWQEVRADVADIPQALLAPEGWHTWWSPAQKKGYSGVGFWSKHVAPLAVTDEFGLAEFAEEGRYLLAEYANLRIMSLYVPSGSAKSERQQAKYRFMEYLHQHIRQLLADGKPLLICGDINIAHQQIDIKNWRSNQKNSGFLPEEREWLTQVLATFDLVDVFRSLVHAPDHYTWWSNRGQAWANNVGWRIDYQLASAQLAQQAKHTSIYTTQRFSDHAPLVIDYAWSLA